ncbi:MAG: sugar transferase [Thermoflexales bacterium]|nr:sugar transferase [Thermoflexales bacterium]
MRDRDLLLAIKRWLSLPLGWRKAALIACDAVLVNLAFTLAYIIRYDLQLFRPLVDPAYDTPLNNYLPFMAVLTLLLLISFRLGGVYELRRGRSWLDTVYAIANGTTTAIIVMVTVTYIFLPVFYSRLIYLYDGILIIILIGLFRLVLDLITARLQTHGIGVDRVLVVGAGELGRMVMRTIAARPELGYRVVGFLDDDEQKGNTDIGRLKALGGLARLPSVLKSENVSDVIITLPWTYHRKIVKLIDQAEREGVRACLVPDLFQLTFSSVDVNNSLGIPLISTKPIRIHGGNLLIKRAFDLSVSALMFLLLWPAMGLAALAIKLDSPGPIIFKQTRVGRGGRLFTCYKFRSMRQGAEEEQKTLQDLNEADGPLFKIRDDPRCTRVGRFLRRTSIDELPQLINVLRGEMSMVGPRPPVPAEVASYQDWHRQRLAATPGLSGMWQISGRSEVSFDEMALLDIWYLENQSLGLDIKILLKTIPVVLRGRGAY